MAFRFGWRSPNILRNGLILYLNASSPNSYNQFIYPLIWKDISLNGNNGTLVNNPTFSSNNGGLLTFDGVNTRVEIPSSTNSNLTTTFTISVWYNPTVLPTAGNLQSIVCKFNNLPVTSLAGGGYDLRLYNASGVQKIGLFTSNQTTIQNGGADINYTMTVGNWYNIVGVYDGSFSKIYVNGSFVNQGANTVTPTANTKTLYIGEFGFYGPINGDLGRYINGKLSQVLIYTRPLSATEITQNYNATKSQYGL